MKVRIRIVDGLYKSIKLMNIHHLKRFSSWLMGVPDWLPFLIKWQIKVVILQRYLTSRRIMWWNVYHYHRKMNDVHISFVPKNISSVWNFPYIIVNNNNIFCSASYSLTYARILKNIVKLSWTMILKLLLSILVKTHFLSYKNCFILSRITIFNLV